MSTRLTVDIAKRMTGADAATYLLSWGGTSQGFIFMDNNTPQEPEKKPKTIGEILMIIFIIGLFLLFFRWWSIVGPEFGRQLPP